MCKQAKKEILIISIGEPIPEESVLINRDALDRGVEIKMIAHKYDRENKDLLWAWSKMGMVIESPNLSRALKDYFYSVWQKAEGIEKKTYKR